MIINEYPPDLILWLFLVWICFFFSSPYYYTTTSTITGGACCTRVVIWLAGLCVILVEWFQFMHHGGLLL